jgi:hypothetical protein
MEILNDSEKSKITGGNGFAVLQVKDFEAVKKTAGNELSISFISLACCW